MCSMVACMREVVSAPSMLLRSTSGLMLLMSWSLRPTSALSLISSTSLPSLKINLPQGVVGAVAGWLAGLAMIGFFAGNVCDDGDTPVWIVGDWAGGV